MAAAFRISAFLFCLLTLSSIASAAPHGPLARSSEAAPYPRGEQLAQEYSHPQAPPSLAPLSQTPGTVSFMAASSVIDSLPETMERSDYGLSPELRTVTRVPVANVAQPAAAPRVVYLFDYALNYKDIPLARYTSQAMAAGVRNSNRKVLFVRDRNIPTREALESLEDLPAPDSEEGKEASIQTAISRAKESNPSIEPVALTESNAPHLEIVVGNPDQAALAWAIVVESKDPAHAFARRYWISARDPSQVVAQEELVYQVDGRVTGSYWPLGQSSLKPPIKDQPLPGCFVATQNGVRIVSDDEGKYTTDANPTFKLLAGPSCRIEDRSGSPVFSATADGTNLKFDATNEFQVAQVSAFHWTNVARQFIEEALTDQANILNQIRTRVNIDDHCNAFFNGTSLNYFRAGDECPNTAYADIVFHEFGHALDAELGGIQDGGYSEGFGDALAILITRDSVVGRDFFGEGEHLRNGQDIVKWPPADTEVHEVGRIYGGFVWELTQQLLSQYAGDQDKAFGVAKGLVLGAAALNPRDIPDAVALSFLVDTQAHQGAHFDALAKAADSRQIPRPQAADDADNLAPAVAAAH